jgi:hypothetical protein
LRHSSQPSALGVTLWMPARCEHFLLMILFRYLDKA